MRDWTAFVRRNLRLPELTPEREARIVREPRPLTIRFRSTGEVTEIVLPTESGELTAKKTT